MRQRSRQFIQESPRAIEVLMATGYPGLAPKKVATGLSPKQPPVRLFEVGAEVCLQALSGGAAAQVMKRLAGLRDALQGVLLRPGPGPLDKAGSMMPAGVPRPLADGYRAVGAVHVYLGNRR